MKLNTFFLIILYSFKLLASNEDIWKTCLVKADDENIVQKKRYHLKNLEIKIPQNLLVQNSNTVLFQSGRILIPSLKYFSVKNRFLLKDKNKLNIEKFSALNKNFNHTQPYCILEISNKKTLKQITKIHYPRIEVYNDNSISIENIRCRSLLKETTKCIKGTTFGHFPSLCKVKDLGRKVCPGAWMNNESAVKQYSPYISKNARKVYIWDNVYGYFRYYLMPHIQEIFPSNTYFEFSEKEY